MQYAKPFQPISIIYNILNKVNQMVTMVTQRYAIYTEEILHTLVSTFSFRFRSVQQN